MTEDIRPGVSWWLWPNVLAFDAPAVAVIWQRFLADVFKITVPVAASIVLGLVVWAIYLTDRRLDGQRVGITRPRHAYAATHSKLFVGLALVATLLAGSVAFTLPLAYLHTGGIVASFVAAYLVVVHYMSVSLWGGKEVLVGALFAAGVAIPLIASDDFDASWFPAIAGFGLLCCLNCRLIEKWEAGGNPSLRLESAIGSAIFGCAGFCPRSVAVALGGATSLLFLLHLVRRTAGIQDPCILADLALLTPLSVWAFTADM